jgi:phosphate transport system permease protein
MNEAPPARAVAASARSDRFHLWRYRKDSVTRWLIAVGGIGVIFAVGLIFFYLLWVVFPLFLPATVSLGEGRAMPGWTSSRPVYFALEEQQEIGLRVSDGGDAVFFNRDSGQEVLRTPLPLDPGETLVASADAVERRGFVALGSSSGRVFVARHQYKTVFAGGVETRRIEPRLEFPYGEEPVLTVGTADVSALAYSDGDFRAVLAAAGSDGLVRVNYAYKSENFVTGETSLSDSEFEIRPDFEVTALAISGDHRWLYLADSRGRLHNYALPDLEPLQVVEVTNASLTAMTMLLGGISVLAGDSEGTIHQLFPVRISADEYRLKAIRSFEAIDGAVRQILPEERRKGFLAVTDEHELGIFHSTAGQRVKRVSLEDSQPLALALSPRANGLMIEQGSGELAMLDIRNEHPEVSFASLWRKVWYENYQQPEHVWQSSAATNEFEPKFGLTPLVFGTLKAAFYAMLFAVPLALMGAAYTAYFMSPQLRQWIKPGIEIMEALPTVILGFLAGLWFAPWVEQHLADLFMMVLLLPPGLLAFSWLWHRWEHPLKELVPEGWEPLLLIPAMLATVAIAVVLAGPVQALLFQGDLRQWLTAELGISYDQRNALVVGVAMGFAVIPTIFSIAEDAVFGVPKSLSNGSLALGATPWQTLVFVVLPTASPGIFSALMIGLGRAVGETMIVLMATGNTPIMDWNLFEGMRTLAANIAVEMPESEVNSSHYRILFLAALVLFTFTFIVNTAAELVRQRLREKYSSI